MGERSAIAWTDATFNPWWGCTKVSPACDHCYAETWAKRVGKPKWGAGEPRRYFGDKHWNAPLKWTPRKVFCASMADVFDNEVEQEHRERLWALIRATPHLTWQLLTKRIGNAKAMLPADFSAETYPNVWVGMTVVTQDEIDRDIGKLREIPAAVRWLSIEPQLEPIRIPDGVQWVVTGGESGSKARPYDISWARSIIEQCRIVGAAPFVKQLGANAIEYSELMHQHINWTMIVCIGGVNDRACADPKNWPPEVRVQEFPCHMPVQPVEPPSIATAK
jgi:protein gp37